ncbi:hypothetical protein PoB_002934000 [Plakobranchus ocellatus]|uniref:Uncharacterized protein n=1 Tax=Plakobranchus ocellatus TaxID=259542 RepID=A0AAV4A7M8_9GAST|nr:hypothetical protein PoB_002934000 [Plakobranchus ocellatus]
MGKLQIGNNGSSYRGDPKSKKKGKAKMDDRRNLKLDGGKRCAKGNKEKYEQIHKKVQEKCNMSKENWINEKCIEIEQQQKHAPQTMCRNIEEITGKNILINWVYKSNEW